MEVNNNFYCGIIPMSETENMRYINLKGFALPLIYLKKNKNTDDIVQGESILPEEIFEQIFLQIGFTALQKASCVNKEWNYHAIKVLKKLDFFYIQLFMDSVYSEIDVCIERTKNNIEHFKDERALVSFIIKLTTDLKQSVEKQTDKKNLIKDILNVASDILSLSSAKNAEYICTENEDLNYLQETKKYLSEYNIRSLIDVELFTNHLMYRIADVLEKIYKNPNTLFPSNIPVSIQAMFKINHFNSKYTLINNVAINYQKLVAIKNDRINEALESIGDNDGAFYLLFCSLMDCKRYDLAFALAKEKEKEDFKTLGSYLARSGYIEAALEWITIETDPVKKENILSGIASELFDVNNHLNMNLVFKTLFFILDQKFDIGSFVKLENICYWLKKYKIQKSDNIDFVLNSISCFPEVHKTAVNHALFFSMIKSNPINEIYDSEVVNKIIPNSEIKNEILLKNFFYNFFSYEKTIEIAEFIPDTFYYNKEDFLLKLEGTQEITPILNKYSSPKKYIISLVSEKRLDEFLTFFDQVSKETYQEIGKEMPLMLMALTVKLAQNDHKEKAKELAKMLPELTYNYLVNKHNL